VLDALARVPDGGVGVRQLAADLGLSRSAVHRVLQTLADLNVARPLGLNGYEAGDVMAAWGAFLSRRHTLLTASRGILERLSQETRETTLLFSWDKDTVALVAAHESDQPIRYVLEIGTKVPLHRGATGKSILSNLPEDRWNQPAWELSAEAASALAADLELTRDRGFATSHGENIPDACGFSSAFFRGTEPIGTITITVPKFRMPLHSEDELGPLVRQASRELTKLLNAS
jgi:IclR family acetate operon transcriptional repressor